MSGCRVSGLSRGKKKSSTIDIKQQNLKDMFSKFSNDNKWVFTNCYAHCGSLLIVWYLILLIQ